MKKNYETPCMSVLMADKEIDLLAGSGDVMGIDNFTDPFGMDFS